MEHLALTAGDAFFQIRNLVRDKGTSSQDLAEKIRKLMRIGHRCGNLTYLAAKETELFLETLDWTTTTMHANMASVKTLEQVKGE